MATGFNRVVNTVVSGTSTLSGLTGNDVRNLEFEAALRQKPAVTMATTTVLTVEQWMQSAIGCMGLNASAAAGTINLGADVASQAAAYVSLFDFKSTNEERLLRFYLADNGNNVTMSNSSGATSNFVKVAVENAGSATYIQTLFANASPIASVLAGSNAGIERLVVLKPSNLAVGSEAVTFLILPLSQ